MKLPSVFSVATIAIFSVLSSCAEDPEDPPEPIWVCPDDYNQKEKQCVKKQPVDFVLSCPSLPSLNLSDKVERGGIEVDRCVSLKYHCDNREDFYFVSATECETEDWKQGKVECDTGYQYRSDECKKFRITEPDYICSRDGYRFDRPTLMCQDEAGLTYKPEMPCDAGQLNSDDLCESEIDSRPAIVRCAPESVRTEGTFCIMLRTVKAKLKCYHGYRTATGCQILGYVEEIKKCPPSSSRDPISGRCHEIIDAEETCVEGYRFVRAEQKA